MHVDAIDWPVASDKVQHTIVKQWLVLIGQADMIRSCPMTCRSDGHRVISSLARRETVQIAIVRTDEDMCVAGDGRRDEV